MDDNGHNRLESMYLEQVEEIRLFHTLVDNSHDMIFILRIDTGCIEYANKTAQENIGYTLDEMQQIGIDAMRRPIKEDETFLAHLQALKEAGQMTDYAIVMRRDGTEFPVEANVRSVHYHGTDYNIAIVRDITERIRAEESLARMNRDLEQLVQERTQKLEHNLATLQSYKMAMDANNIISISDPSGRITYVNDSFCNVTGYTPDEVIGKSHRILRHPETDSALFTDLWQTIQSKKIWKAIFKNRKKNGDTYIVDAAIVPVLDEHGEIVEYIAIRHEITELYEKKERLKRFVYVDEMTGFGSRQRLIEDISQAQNPLLALIDIDKFNNINDFYGIEFGDRLLKEFAMRIHDQFGDEIQYYRLHGDQFAVLGDQSSMSDFESRISTFLNSVNRSNFVFEGKEITLRITVSLSAEKDSKLFSSCDLAKRYAKKHQKPFVIYTPELGLEEEVHKNMACSVRLQHAIAQDRIEVFVQPIASCGDGTIEKYECLMRLIAEDGTIVSPFQFLDAAKQSKQYAELSKAVIRKAFDLIERFSQHSFSINITIEDIFNEELSTLIIDRLSAKRSPSPVIFELVESEGIENFAEVAEFIRRIKAHGALLAIDDFGTGYSNFEFLLKLDADIVKIDGSLIRNIETDPNIEEIVSLIVEFARRQKMQTVAEFVASEGILQKIRQIGIDYAQGYLIGKPEPMK